MLPVNFVALFASISTIHAIVSLSLNASETKHVVKLSSNQTWVIYSPSPFYLGKDGAVIRSSMFKGIMRFAILPNSDAKCREILDRFSPCYLVSGDAGLVLGKQKGMEIC